MLQTSRILVSAFNHAPSVVIPAAVIATVLLGLTGCGQTGKLYLPTEPAAAHRASLPGSLWPVMPKKKAENQSNTNDNKTGTAATDDASPAAATPAASVPSTTAPTTDTVQP